MEKRKLEKRKRETNEWVVQVAHFLNKINLRGFP